MLVCCQPRHLWSENNTSGYMTAHVSTHHIIKISTRKQAYTDAVLGNPPNSTLCASFTSSQSKTSLVFCPCLCGDTKYYPHKEIWLTLLLLWLRGELCCRLPSDDQSFLAMKLMLWYAATLWSGGRVLTPAWGSGVVVFSRLCCYACPFLASGEWISVSRYLKTKERG